MIRALVFTRSAISTFRQSSFPEAWLDTFAEDLVDPSVVVRREGDVVIVASRRQDPEERLLVLAVKEHGLFPGYSAADKATILDRCLRFATIVFDGSAKLPPSWKPYHAGSLVTFFATYGKGGDRWVVASPADGTPHIYAIELSDREDVYRLESYVPDYTSFRAAVAEWNNVRARLSASNPESALNTQVDLTSALSEPVRYELKYEDWLPRLTPQQTRFVEMEVHGPLKLRGAAGTGKTVAMILKFLREAYLAANQGRRARLLFVTHSWGVAEQVDRALTHIDSRGLYREGKGEIELHVLPLLSLVSTELSYSDAGLRSLGTDSQDGKSATLRVIIAVLDAFIDSDWVAYRGAVSDKFRSRVEAPEDSAARRALLWDLMNEFACVLGAQRVGVGTDSIRREDYLYGKRSAALMPLEAEADRIVVLRLYGRFLDRLRGEGLLSSDQLVNDYLVSCLQSV